MDFKSNSWQWFAFCEEPDKSPPNISIFFHIGCICLGVCDSTSSDSLEMNKIEVHTNIFKMAGSQT